MTIKQLQHFQGICFYQNITKASEKLYISQPALTTSLRELEKNLNINLIKRTKKGLLLTPEGEFFLEKTNNFLKHYDNLIEETKDFINNNKHIKIGISLQLGVQILPIIFDEFKKQFQDVQIEIFETGGRATVNRVLDEEVQIAIAGVSGNLSDELLIEPLFKTRVCFCTNKNHPFSKLKSIKLEDALKEKHVSLGDSFFLHSLIEKEIKNKNLQSNTLFSTNQIGTIKTMITSGIASAFLVEPAIDKNDNIVAVPLEEEIPIIISIITKKKIALYKNTIEVKKFFIENFKTI